MEPQLIANYLMDIASSFHHYYAVHKVITDKRDLSTARLNLINAVRQVIYNGLTILNISTPEKM
jgi:arginyl-tRNA synthetase